MVTTKNQGDPSAKPATAVPGQRRLMTVFTYLAVGLALNIAVALIAAAVWDLSGSSYATALRWKDGDSFSVVRRSGRTFSLVVAERSRNAKRAWGPEQVIGAPDAATGHDDELAWASMAADGNREWLKLSYQSPVRANAIQVYENYNPGAICAIQLFDASGACVGTIQSPTTTQPKATSMPSVWPIGIDAEISSVQLEIDSASVPGWNEVDACGLVSVSGSVSWADDAVASTSYADRNTSGERPEDLIPSWSGLTSAMPAFERGGPFEERVTIGFGWPMIALRSSASEVSPVIRRILDARTTPSLPVALFPWVPVWPGFFVNTLAFGVTAWLAVWIITRPRRIFVEVMRMRRGRCVQCGYDLRFDFAGGCPECGWLR